jgi:hypothetical protein
MNKKVWMFTNTPPKCKLHSYQKDEIKALAQKFLEDVFKPTVIQAPPDNPRHNYLIDVSVKWHGAYLIFSSKYACPMPNAISPDFETPLARFGYFSHDNWSVWGRRHNDQWMDLHMRVTFEELLNEMLKNPWFNQG